MQLKSIAELEKKYDLELDRIVSEVKSIQKEGARVLLQFPDGLKQYATFIVDYLGEAMEQQVEFVIWGRSCFGACDIPQVDEGEFDLVVQFGHAPWKQNEI